MVNVNIEPYIRKSRKGFLREIEAIMAQSNLPTRKGRSSVYSKL